MYCECGCGQKTKLAPYTSKEREWVKGLPLRFIHKHTVKLMVEASRVTERNQRKENNNNWKGGRSINNGYVRINPEPEHPRFGHGSIQEHVVIAERVLRKRLPLGAMVHHVNEDQIDNCPNNLVICQDQAYHKLIHVRTRAYKQTGNPNARKCKFCPIWILPTEQDIRIHRQKGRSASFSHGECARNYDRQSYLRRCG